MFDTNGIGLSFVPDSVVYRNYASDMATALTTQGLSSWLGLQASLHVRLYSIAFALVGWLLGHNVLAAEFLNLFYYLGILLAVYFLGKEIFNERAALIASVLIGIWPSFLLHTTQLLRDPISILGLLIIVYSLTLLLNREFTSRVAIQVAITSVAIMTFFWLLRGNMWIIVQVATLICGLLLVLKMVGKKKFLGYNLSVFIWLCIVAVMIPSTMKSSSMPNVNPPTAPLSAQSDLANKKALFSRLVYNLDKRRDAFKVYQGQASNIDGDVHLNSVADVIRYLPRASEIGMFSPFPNFWLQSPIQVGRVVGGLETLLMYVLYVLAALGIWTERKRWSMWLLFLIAITGMISLGLIVINQGALFRLRYFFWMLIILIAAQGFFWSASARRRVFKAS